MLQQTGELSCSPESTFASAHHNRRTSVAVTLLNLKDTSSINEINLPNNFENATNNDCTQITTNHECNNYIDNDDVVNDITTDGNNCINCGGKEVIDDRFYYNNTINTINDDGGGNCYRKPSTITNNNINNHNGNNNNNINNNRNNNNHKCDNSIETNRLNFNSNNSSNSIIIKKQQHQQQCCQNNHRSNRIAGGYLIAVHRKLSRQETYFLSYHKSRPSLFGVPLLIPCYEGGTNKDLYCAVWIQVARLLSPLPPTPPDQANHATDW